MGFSSKHISNSKQFYLKKNSLNFERLRAIFFKVGESDVYAKLLLMITPYCVTIVQSKVHTSTLTPV